MVAISFMYFLKYINSIGINIICATKVHKEKDQLLLSNTILGKICASIHFAQITIKLAKLETISNTKINFPGVSFTTKK